ncbi:MAG TPA: glycosyltransferase 87 family protein, partial [Candidatus Limnocylindrales bacterium]
MTARAAGVPSRGADAPTRTTWTRDGVGAVLTVLVLGLAFRLIFAQANPNIGLSFDLDSFRGWASNLASEGLHGFYERPFFHDYTPGYLYVLWIVGTVGQALGGIGDLIKIPAIIADVALGWLVWSMVRELGGSARAALVGALLVVVNPVTWFDSVVWGQVDSFGLVFLLLGVRELWRDRPERAALWTVIAALIKPQLGILIPVVAVVTIRRALWPSGGQGRPDPGSEAELEAPAAGGGLLGRARAWEVRTDRPIRIVTTGLIAIATTYLLCLPFGLSVIELTDGGLRSGLIEQVFKTAGGYPYVSVNAYNPWALAELNGNGLAASGGWICDVVITNPVPGGPQCPEAFMVGPVPAVLIGTALLVGAFVLICAAIVERPDRLTILLGVTLLAIAFFVLPTRVHERYMFPFFALGAILAAVSWRWLVAYIALSVAAFLNMYVVLAVIYPNAEYHTMDWLGIGSWLRDDWGLPLVAITNLVVAIWAFAQLRARGRATLAAEIDAPYVDEVEIGLPSLAGGGAVARPAAAPSLAASGPGDWTPATALGTRVVPPGAPIAAARPADAASADVVDRPMPRWTEP